MLTRFLLTKFSFSFLLASFVCGASFNEIEHVLEQHNLFNSAEKRIEIATRIRETHQILANEQNKLYVGIQEETESAENMANSARTVKSGGSKKTKSNKSVSPDLSSTNFAMSNLCVVTNSDKIINVPLANHSDQFVYDSCVDGTHNIVPDLEACQDQWRLYLGTNALILGDKSKDVKQKIIASKENITNFVGVLCKACNEQASSQALATLENIKNEIKSYHGYIKTWNTCGWHSEQRIVYDLDSTRIEEELKTIHETNGIKIIIACVHTRLAPCIAKADSPDKLKRDPSTQTCDCYHTLRNWSSRWTFKNKIANLPLAMTVSYVDYSGHTKEAEYNRLDRNTPNFFLQQLTPADVIDNENKGKTWLNSEVSFAWHHMNMYKTPSQISSAYESDLMSIMKPFTDKYNVYYEKETDLTMEFEGIRLQRLQTAERIKHFSIRSLSCIQALNSLSAIQALDFSLVGADEFDPMSLSILTAPRKSRRACPRDE